MTSHGPREPEEPQSESASPPAARDRRGRHREVGDDPRRGGDREDAPQIDLASAPRTWHDYTLQPFQREAIAAIRSGHDVLVAAPTGAGKTLVAEYAIEDAVRAGRRCIYTSPIKALSNQKYRDFRDDPNVDVGLTTGDVTIHPGAQVLIMTTEILRNAIFENPEPLRTVEYVVFDEIHFLDDAERGMVWEEALIFAPPTMRFICLSATVSNVRQIGAWIDDIRPHRLAVVESPHRPVPLTHRLYYPGAGSFSPKAIARVAGRAQRRRRGKGGRRSSSPAAAGMSSLLDELQAEDNLPALVFSFSRRECERLATRNSRRELLDADETATMVEMQQRLLELFQLEESMLDSELFRMARRGLGFHHAGMLPIYKELVERMFTSGLLKLLFTTETFALGINMPARAVVFHSLRKFDGVSIDYMLTREYLQMAGRAGRQGLDEEGLVYSLLDDRDLADAPLKRLLGGTPEPVKSRFRMSYSTILHLLSSLGRERLLEAWEKSFHQFQNRDRSAKAQAKMRAKQRRQVEASLAFLTDRRFLDRHDELTPKGHTARQMNAYEIQIAELLHRGALENLPPQALAMVFVALVFEDRRRGRPERLPRRLFGGVRRHVGEVLARLIGREAEFDGPVRSKLPDWGLTPVVLAWCEGATMEDLMAITDVSPGDLCRTFRMALQIMRQVRVAIDPEWDLHANLGTARQRMNRDEIDARRQLELG